MVPKDSTNLPDPQVKSATVSLNGEQLNWLLDGFDLWRNKPHQSLFYQSND